MIRYNNNYYNSNHYDTVRPVDDVPALSGQVERTHVVVNRLLLEAKHSIRESEQHDTLSRLRNRHLVNRITKVRMNH